MTDTVYRFADPNSPITKLQDVLALGRRHRRVIALAFAGVFLGTLLVAVFSPLNYQARTTLIVRQQRLDPLVSADSSTPMPSSTQINDIDINSEVELIKSQDILENVAIACDLTGGIRSRDTGSVPTDDPQVLAASVLKVRSSLKVTPVAKTNLISISYDAANPQKAAQVLNTLVRVYMDKRLALHQSADTLDFFAQQTQRYQQGLAQAESRLSEFSQKAGVVSPEQQKDATLQKLSEFQADVKQTETSISEIQKRIETLEAQQPTLQPRVVTQVRMSDNPQLMVQLKSTLLNLELKRTELLQKFQPTYRLVQEVDTQIVQTRSAIEAAGQSQLRDETTDSNPTYQWVDSELAKEKSELTAQQARAEALGQAVRSYQQKAKSLDDQQMLEQDLVRDEKAQESNYLLYQRKEEEARISNALDRSHIVNVAVAEPAETPVIPTRSRLFTFLVGLFAALITGIGSAVAAEYLSPSLKTPEDVQVLLDVPVLVSVSSHRR
jgi:uncharacterized protein involved in exopolysaccharide biosynthesis